MDRLAQDGVPVGSSLDQARELARLDQSLTLGFRIVAGVGLAGYAAAFADTSALRVALDQELADFDAPLAGVREVAFFPPMTGG